MPRKAIRVNLMKIIIVLALMMIISPLSNGIPLSDAVNDTAAETTGSTHNWVEQSTSYETIEVGTHEYSYWKNFLRHTRSCRVSHVIKTVVYYCEEHDHTKTETELVETIHSGHHS
jgi:5-bromo-4-chloroindolyl phosphate hydrolysis protein